MEDTARGRCSSAGNGETGGDMVVIVGVYMF
jgi:hypothetical protein